MIFKDKNKQGSTLNTSALNDWPDLVVIDGGKGLLSKVMHVIRELKLEEDLNVCSLAKRKEEVYIPGKKEPLESDKDQIGIKLLRNLRDEAHRFAITYHRNKRSKRQTKSSLSEIPTLGPNRIKKLLGHFNSVEAIYLASIEDIKSVEGIGIELAKVIWNYLHHEQ